MTGSGGKAGWALRGGARKVGKVVGGKQVLNPFDAWLNAVAGPQRSLGAQVIESDGLMKKFHGDLSTKSRLFKNFWLENEVSADDLMEDRIRFTQEGMAVHKRAEKKYPKIEKPIATLAPGSVPLHTLFTHYNVTRDKKEVEPGLKSLGALLGKSHKSLERHQKPEKVFDGKPKL